MAQDGIGYSQSYRDRDRRFLWHPFSSRSEIDSQPFPIITRGEGIYLFDNEGNRYLDAISSWWAGNLGHSHPRLVRAIRHQASRLQHSILGNLSHPAAIELAEKLSALFKTKRRVFFASDGACAVEAALKIAVQYWYNLGHPERHRIVSLAGAYHGDTLGAVSAGYSDYFHRAFKQIVVRSLSADSPCCSACAWGKNRHSCELECFESMRKIIESGAEDIAAVIVEPLCQAAGGMRIYPAEYLMKLAALCRKHKVLLIADEIAVGLGRSGRMFAFEHAGIDPDIVCLGKGLSGGCLPISAAVVKEGIYRTFTDRPVDHTFYHGHTFAGNPISAAAALETLRIYEEDHIVKRASELGALLQQRVSDLKNICGVHDVRGLGMIAAVELEHVDSAEQPQTRSIRNILLQRGILLRPLGDVLYLMPPLITPEQVLHDLMTVFQETIKEVLGNRNKAHSGISKQDG